MPRLILFILLAAPAFMASAEAYRWVDREGRVHYGQVPPPGAQAQVVGPARGPGTAPNQDSLNKALEDGAKQDAERKAQAEKLAAEQAQRNQRCRTAMEALAYLDASTARRLARTDEKGQPVRLTEAEFQKRREEQQKAIEQNCD